MSKFHSPVRWPWAVIPLFFLIICAWADSSPRLTRGGVDGGGFGAPSGKMVRTHIGRPGGGSFQKISRKKKRAMETPSLEGPDPSFVLGEVYSFPNPARGREKPTLHVEVGVADSVQLSFYDPSGEKVHEVDLAGRPLLVDDGQGPQYAYEYAWTGDVPSGGYICRMVARKNGESDIKKIIKLAVIR